MKRTILLLILPALCLAACKKNTNNADDPADDATFFKTYTDTNSLYGAEVFAAEDGSLYLLGNNSSGSSGCSIIHTDRQGNVRSRSKSIPYNIGVTAFDGHYFYMYQASDTVFNAGSNTFFLKFDTQGNLVFEKDTRYDLLPGINLSNTSCYLTTDHTLLLYGDYKDTVSSKRHPVLISCSTEGEILWNNLFADSVFTGDRFFHVTETADGGYLLSTAGYYYKVGSDGALIWRKEAEKSLGEETGLISLPGSRYLSINKSKPDDPYDIVGVITVMDADGHYTDSTSLSSDFGIYAGLTDKFHLNMNLNLHYTEKPDGGAIISAGYRSDNINLLYDGYQYRGAPVFYNIGPDGKVNATKTLKQDGTDFIISNMMIAPDNRLLICGITRNRDDYVFYPFIFKTDFNEFF